MYENTFAALKGPSLKAPCNPGCLASLAAPQLGDAGPLVSKHLSGGVSCHWMSFGVRGLCPWKDLTAERSWHLRCNVCLVQKIPASPGLLQPCCFSKLELILQIIRAGMCWQASWPNPVQNPLYQDLILSYSSPMDLVFLLPIYRWSSWGCEWLRNIPNIILLQRWDLRLVLHPILLAIRSAFLKEQATQINFTRRSF